MATAVLATPAEIIAAHRELVRTGNHTPLGRMQKIAIGPSASWRPPDPPDPYIARYGRFIELRDRFLPIAQGPNKEILVTAPLRMPDARVGLPDIPDPTWTPAAPTRDDIEGKAIGQDRDGKPQYSKIVNGQRVYSFDQVEAATRVPPMIAQRMTDRCEQDGSGKPGYFMRAFLGFQPVLRVTFQPELENRLVGTSWYIEFAPDLDGKSCVLLVDKNTGECFFLFGRYDIFTPLGE
jgi:hypothetical protein